MDNTQTNQRGIMPKLSPDYARTEIVNGESINSMKEKAMKFHNADGSINIHDGPGYYPGMYAKHRGNPSSVAVEMSAAHDEGRTEPFNTWVEQHGLKMPERVEAVVMGDHGEIKQTIYSNDLATWGKDPLPPVYFDAVRLEADWTRFAHNINATAVLIREALRNVRHAETETEKQQAVRALSEVVAKVNVGIDAIR